MSKQQHQRPVNPKLVEQASEYQEFAGLFKTYNKPTKQVKAPVKTILKNKQ